MKNKGKILVVDDNLGIRKALQMLLPPHFAEVEIIPSPNSIESAMRRQHPDVVLLDMNFYADINTGNEGLYWIDQIKRMYPDVQVVLFTAYADIALAVEGMKRGAFDFVVKPWDNDRLIEILQSAIPSKTKKSQPQPSAPEMYWGESPAMMQIRDMVRKIAPTDASVLITGENGTGKDVLAHEIHSQSLRSGQPIVCVDAGAITETLFESELFGHVKGAFTDAHTDHVGKFEQAHGGTLFLDEIGNIPLHLQAKLLRVLQNRVVSRVGSEKQIPIDIRLICATNMDLEAMVREGRFRQDLYYRINTMQLRLPSLRERAADIVPLAELFMRRYAERYHRPVCGISSELAQQLATHSWKGNIRELQNVIEKAVILSEGPMLTTKEISLNTNPQPTSGAKQTLDEAEEMTIRDAVARCNGNLSMVAKELGISRPTLYSKLKKYDI